MSIGHFAAGFGDGMLFRRDRKERETERAERKADREALREAARRQGASSPGIVDGWGFSGDLAPQSGAGTGQLRPHQTGDPVLTGLAPHQKAFLNTIAGGESGGRYNVRYSPKGGALFEGYDQHPGIFEPGPHGPSSAAGRYQFTKTTWDQMGGGAFTPERQDMRAYKLASERYSRATGRSLDEDLQARGVTSEMLGALSGTWAAFKGDPSRHIATYNASMQRYGSAPPVATSGPPAAQTAQKGGEWGTLRRIMTA